MAGIVGKMGFCAESRKNNCKVVKEPEMLVLGIDVSTVKFGIAVLDSAKHIVHTEFQKLDNKTSLESRALVFESKLIEILKKYPIEKIGIEAPIISIGGGNGHAATVAVLQRFNGMASFVVRKIFGADPIMVNSISARKAAGVPIVRRGKQTMLERKKPIIETIERIYADTLTPFEYQKTVHGNPVEGTDDIADGIVVAIKLLTFAEE
jgi:hypothetical protein